MEKLDIPEELIQKIRKYVEAGRFRDFNDFFIQAARLLLYAEDNKENFERIIKR